MSENGFVPALGWTAPFATMLLAIAVLPLAVPAFWESNARKLGLSALLGLPVLILYARHHPPALLHTGEEYLSFIALLGSLFVVSGGILVTGDLRATPRVNAAFLATGSVLASLVGTTGASVVLIRPLLSTNQERRHVVHTVVFFIFIVSNTGGCLTPLGDPPLFLGYLRGVPFTWTLRLLPHWLLVNGVLLATYFLWDRRAHAREPARAIARDRAEVRPVRVSGLWNVALLMLVVAVALAALGVAGPHPAREGDGERPRVFRLDPDVLQETKRRIRARDTRLEPALARLRADAQKALEAGPFSVVTKTTLPPSGDKHDYMSQAPYFWPDPHRPDGLPYVRRDGERNPEIRKISDRDGLGGLISSAETLALAYYFLGDEAYAARAARLLRIWFLDPATRMNPHLEYAQAIPGVNQGRGIGIIETSGLGRLVDAVGLLAGSKAWTPADQRGLAAWFGGYLRWLRESRHGRDEAATTNNHGTHYDAQVASLALVTDQPSLAAAVLSESRQRRIAAQIQPDGNQPRELERTRAWSYSVTNLGGFFSLAALGERSGVDLWHYETPDGRSIRRALDWLVPFARGEAWPYPQITPWSPRDLAPLLREAAVTYRDPRYEELIARMSGVPADDRLQLTHPAAHEGPRLGLMRHARRWGVVLTRVDPTTLRPFGPEVAIGEYHYAWSFSPDRAHLAIAISAPTATGRVGIRIVDLARMEVAIDVSTGIAAEALGWLKPARLVAALQTGEVVVVDTATGQIVHRSRLPQPLDAHVAPQPAVPANSGLVILVESPERRGPVHLAVADTEGRLRTVTLEREHLDDRQPTLDPRPLRARLVVDAGGDHAFVVGPGGWVAEVDLDTLRVRYRQDAAPLSHPERVRELPDGGWLELLL